MIPLFLLSLSVLAVVAYLIYKMAYRSGYMAAIYDHICDAVDTMDIDENQLSKIIEAALNHKKQTKCN